MKKTELKAGKGMCMSDSDLVLQNEKLSPPCYMEVEETNWININT